MRVRKGPSPAHSSDAHRRPLRLRPDGQKVGFGVEDVFVQANEVKVVGEQQVEVLQRLSQEEALHLVPRTWVLGISDVVYRSVATCRNLQGQ